MHVFRISNKIETKKSNVWSGRGVFAKSDIKKGEVLIDIEAKITGIPSDYTLQINESEYLVADYIDNLINHSCNPNILIKLYTQNKKRVSYIALKNIKRGQELFWNYNTTEWDLVTKFICRCSSKKCIGKISGAKYLTKKQVNKILPLMSSYIKMKVTRASRQRGD